MKTNLKPGGRREERKYLTCSYCGIRHGKVEVAGIWACANPFCQGPGATWMRIKCSSYREDYRGKHSVDIDEWRELSARYLSRPDRWMLRGRIALQANEKSKPGVWRPK